MIDFLFLMLSLFATMALSRASLYDADIQLASLKKGSHDRPVQGSSKIQQIHISIDALGSYKWLTEFQEHPMKNAADIQTELTRQYQIGALAQDKTKTEVLLHADQRAAWKPIAEAIFAIRELGFSVYPVYTEDDVP